MSGPDVSRLSPADCVASLRSYPRRYSSLLTSFTDDESPGDLLHRAGPDGRSAVDHADHAARSIALLGRCLQDVLVQERPVLPPAALDDAAREWGQPAPQSVQSVLDFLQGECDAMAAAIEGAHGEAWARVADVAGAGRTVTALDVAREAVRVGAAELRATEDALAAARRP